MINQPGKYRSDAIIVDHKPRVLFFSTSDSTRSQMVEGFLRKFAGEELAVREIGVDISEQHSSGVTEAFKEHFSYVITVSDDSRERSPVWPFSRNLFHWIADPERVDGSAEQKREAFRHVRDEISWKVREFLAGLHGSQRSPNRATV
jgi:arsenate reductase